MKQTYTFENDTPLLEPPLPADFNKVCAENYKTRLQEVIDAGMQYTPLYFFIRNSMKMHQRLAVQ